MLDPALQAVADSTRRAILQRLAHGQATVGQLAALFPISRPAVSQHLRVLKDAELVRTSGPGRLSAYQLTPAPLLEIEHWASTVAATWANGPLPRDESASIDSRSTDSRTDRARRTEEIR
jgi:DNA-binding transcriptional ArsR family regulator